MEATEAAAGNSSASDRTTVAAASDYALVAGYGE